MYHIGSNAVKILKHSTLSHIFYYHTYIILSGQKCYCNVIFNSCGILCFLSLILTVGHTFEYVYDYV